MRATAAPSRQPPGDLPEDIGEGLGGGVVCADRRPKIMALSDSPLRNASKESLEPVQEPVVFPGTASVTSEADPKLSSTPSAFALNINDTSVPDSIPAKNSPRAFAPSIEGHSPGQTQAQEPAQPAAGATRVKKPRSFLRCLDPASDCCWQQEAAQGEGMSDLPRGSRALAAMSGRERRPPHPPSRPADAKPQASHPSCGEATLRILSGCLNASPEMTDGLNSPEDAWEERLRRTGACARLVRYIQGDVPRRDVSFNGGDGKRLQVTWMRAQGRAHLAGVKLGDTLASIDGWQVPKDYSVETVYTKLVAPCILVFLGFIGKMNAEVRLTTQLPKCGLALREELVRDVSPLALALGQGFSSTHAFARDVLGTPPTNFSGVGSNNNNNNNNNNGAVGGMGGVGGNSNNNSSNHINSNDYSYSYGGGGSGGDSGNVGAATMVRGGAGGNIAATGGPSMVPGGGDASTSSLQIGRIEDEVDFFHTNESLYFLVDGMDYRHEARNLEIHPSSSSSARPGASRGNKALFSAVLAFAGGDTDGGEEDVVDEQKSASSAEELSPKKTPARYPATGTGGGGAQLAVAEVGNMALLEVKAREARALLGSIMRGRQEQDSPTSHGTIPSAGGVEVGEPWRVAYGNSFAPATYPPYNQQQQQQPQQQQQQQHQQQHQPNFQLKSYQQQYQQQFNSRGGDADVFADGRVHVATLSDSPPRQLAPAAIPSQSANDDPEADSQYVVGMIGGIWA